MTQTRTISDNSDRSIIFVTISMTGGGTERVISVLANYWASLCYDISIIMIAGNDIAYELDDRVEIKHLSSASNGSTVARIGRIKAMRKEFKSKNNPTIIAMGTVASMFTAVAALGLRNRVILSERNDPNRLNHRPIREYERIVRNFLYNFADRVVFQTKMAQETFPEYIKQRSRIIMNPLVDNLPIIQSNDKREKIIMTAGRLTAQKNHRLLIDAFIEFHMYYSEYTLKIYGEGELEVEIREYILENKAEEYIHLCGFSENLYGEMNKALIYVSSSDWEGMSNSLMEAMAMGMIVIATDCPMGGSAMLIKDEVNGKLVHAGNRKEIVDALMYFVNQKPLDSYYKEAEKVRRLYSVENIAKQWEGLF